MSEPSAFIPGRPGAAEPPLVAYRPAQPLGVAGGYVRSLTRGSGLVVDLFCQGPRLMEEAVEAGRRALGVSVNPVLLHIAREGLTPPETDGLNAAFTRLADTPKAHVSLGTHLDALYRTRCPSCDTPGIAEWFAWHRDRGRPYEKAVCCRRCEKLQVGPTDAEDVALAHSFAPRGLPYYYALDRAAPMDHPSRERAAELVACYTPRNLSALMELIRTVDGIVASGRPGAALKSLLLDCFDRCSKLYPKDEDRARPRTLRVPVRYLERNVWRCLENRLSHYGKRARRSSYPEAADPEALIGGLAEGYALVACAAREVGRILPSGSVDLVLVDPPRPDGVFWALSALWSAWLWRSEEARALRPYLRRRRFDWDWHWQALRDALGEVGPRLTEQGRLVTLFSSDEEELLVSVCLAAANADYSLRGWGYAPEAGYRLVWSWDGPTRVRSVEGDQSLQAMADGMQEAMTDTLQRRREPTPERLLRAAAHARLAERGLLRVPGELRADEIARDRVGEAFDNGLQAAPMTRVNPATPGGDAQWWLRESDRESDSLADRIEALVRQLLSERLVWIEDELLAAVYARFSGPLTPDLTLVRTCLSSYGTYTGSEVRLRHEDNEAQRRREIETVCRNLLGLGRRLGFRTCVGDTWDVRWRADGHPGFLFVVSATALLARWLLTGHPGEVDGEKCLVVPGGRAELIHLKLQRDPRLVEAVESGAWQFIKFRHLRRLMDEEDLDRQAFEIVLGLDPIAEQEHAQLSLL